MTAAPQGKLNVKGLVAEAKQMGIPDREIHSRLLKTPQYGALVKEAGIKGFNPSEVAKQFGLVIQATNNASNRRNFTPPDVSKTADQKVQQEQLKKQGPTQLWESGLLSLADVGVPVVQAAEYAADGIRGGLNKLLGTNLETDRYEKLTKTYKTIDNNHKTVRKANNQGADLVRIGGNMLLTAPLAASGGTLKAGELLASREGAEFLVRNAAVGALIGTTGIHENNWQRLLNMGAGALGGAIGAGVGQKAGEGITKVAQKTRNKVGDVIEKLAPTETNRILQSIDDKLGTTNINVDLHINNALKTKGLKLSDLSDDVAKGLRTEAKKALESGKNLNPEAVVRKVVLDRVGIRGTRAQVTGDPKLWQQEAELSKISGGEALRDKFLSDNKKLAELLGESIESTGGKAVDQYAVAQDAMETLTGRYAKNKEFIGSAYDIARNTEGSNAVLDGKAFVQEANDLLEQNYASMTLPASVKKMLKDIEKNPESFTLNKADELIKLLNGEYKSALKPMTGEGTSASRAIGLVRDALNNRQAQALDGLLGNDSAVAYKFARDAYKANNQLKDQIPILKDALKGVQPDKVFTSRILGGTVEDLDKTIEVLSANNPQVVRDIKQQTLEYISNQAIKQNGQPSPAAMKSALDKIGDRKLSILFSPEEVRRIKDIGMAMDYLVTQPAHSYVNNSNTASGLMNYFGRWIKSAGDWGQHIPVIGNNIVQPVQAGATKLGVSRATNGAASLAGKTPLPATQTSQSLIDQLTKLGLIGGGNLSE
ncbi:MAG TPA: hypothetical protein DCD99_11425 [Acinetobacter schindleri]|nr:hypothetical protein [Acinetobacter schindleri]